MTLQEKEIHYLPIKTTKDIFTIGGCGKFNEDKKHLSKTEAMFLYVELNKWIFAEEKTETENIYLNRLKEAYKNAKKEYNNRLILKNCYEYDAMRLFCLDTQLIAFNDIDYKGIAEDMKYDYTEVTYQGKTYLHRD